MNSAVAGGVEVSLSIDLELPLGAQTDENQQRLEIVAAGLLEVLEQGSLPATWGVSDPSLSAARDAILGARAGHEIAVLGDPIWLGNGTMPSRLSREFERRFAGARRAGLQVSTLLLRHEIGPLDLSLLLQHGITAVRGPQASFADSSKPRHSACRFSIWQVEQPLSLPLHRGWWHAEQWAFRQHVQSALRGRSLHWVLDAGQMVELPDMGLPAAVA
ncbi:MAG TPA: hypothetical protein VFW62_07720, partial [bacterium]|nr:hypothetical protein [bacterium]